MRDGNIGGILSRTTATDGAAFYSYDDNGNVTLLTEANGADVGRYRYDAFGNTLEADGPRAAENPFRFSTKELHAQSGLVDFGYRFYSPGLGRWMNRDPLEEEGGINLYGAMGNNLVNNVDEYGLTWLDDLVNGGKRWVNDGLVEGAKWVGIAVVFDLSYAVAGLVLLNPKSTAGASQDAGPPAYKPSVRDRLRNAGPRGNGLPGGGGKTGPYRFLPKVGYDPRNPLPMKNGGYEDRFGNVWNEEPYHGDPKLPFIREWDVKLSPRGEKRWNKKGDARRARGGGVYLNVRPDGFLSH